MEVPRDVRIDSVGRVPVGLDLAQVRRSGRA
jgi:hypothetical protein